MSKSNDLKTVAKQKEKENRQEKEQSAKASNKQIVTKIIREENS